QRRQAEQLANRSDLSRRTRRYWRRQIPRSAEQEQQLQQSWQEIAEPIATRLNYRISHAGRDHDEALARHRKPKSWLPDHPEVEQRLRHIEQLLSAEHTRDRLEHLRTIDPPEHDLGLGL